MAKKMFNENFYPTPSKLAKKMVSMISSHGHNDKILEPSAGKGDLLTAIFDMDNYSEVDYCEIETDLQSLLMRKFESKRCYLIDADFLKMRSTKQYSTIIMNPPFSDGIKHILKAWDMIYSGDVICLLNAETIRNQNTRERHLLKEIIDNHGTVEFIKDAFKIAERKTSVEIALIKLSKKNKIEIDYFEGLTEAGTYEEPEHEVNEIMLPKSQIENSVLAYNKAIETKKEAIIKDCEAQYYSNMIRKKIENNTDNKEFTQVVKESYNKYVEELRESAWMDVVSMADFHKHMTERVRDEINTQISIVKKMEFSEENIKKFLWRLVDNQKEINNQCVLDVFDMFTKYHKENRIHIEGWKSNDVFFVGRRVVLPYMTEDYFRGVNLHWNAKQKVADIDRVALLIMGHVEKSLIQAIEEAHEAHGCIAGIKITSSFFSVRLYKKGTMHIYHDDRRLLENFNLIVGRYRKWLPEDRERVPKEFWLSHNKQYNKKEIKK